jgi:hypothetical protein
LRWGGAYVSFSGFTPHFYLKGFFTLKGSAVFSSAARLKDSSLATHFALSFNPPHLTVVFLKPSVAR